MFTPSLPSHSKLWDERHQRIRQAKQLFQEEVVVGLGNVVNAQAASEMMILVCATRHASGS